MVYFLFPNAISLKKGAILNATIKPNSPVNSTSLLKIDVVFANRSISPLSDATAIFFTAEVPRPKFVICPIKAIVEVKMETIPMPVGPSKIAMALLLTTEIIIMKN